MTSLIHSHYHYANACENTPLNFTIFRHLLYAVPQLDEARVIMVPIYKTNVSPFCYNHAITHYLSKQYSNQQK